MITKEQWGKFIRIVWVLSIALLVTACSGSAQSVTGNGENEAINLSISSSWPGPHTQHMEVFEPFIEDIEKKTEGRVTGTMYTGDALGTSEAQYDLAVSGIADMSISLHGVTPGRFPATSVTELPFLGESAEEGTRIFWSLYEKFPEVFDQEHNGTKIAWLFKNDPAQILTADQPIHSPEDLEGLRIRTPSPAANTILESYGAIPVSLPMAEVYDAMQKGVVDGVLGPASVFKNFQLGDVTSYITKGDFYTSSIFVVINELTWEQISSKDQEAIEELIGERLAIQAGKKYDQDAQEGWEDAKEAGVEIYEISEEEYNLWREPLEHLYSQWLKDMEDEDIPAQDILAEVMRLADEGEKIDE